MPFLPLLLLLPLCLQADLFHDMERARDDLQRMLQYVRWDMLRHLCSTSVHLAELPLTEIAAKQLSGTLSLATIQDVSCFCGYSKGKGCAAGDLQQMQPERLCRDWGLSHFLSRS